MNKTSSVKNITDTAVEQLGGKASAFSANTGLEWEIRERKLGDDATARLFAAKRPSKEFYPDDHAVWSISEAMRKKDGIPTFLRTAMLLRRKTDAPFSLLIEVVSGVDFMLLEPKYQALFGQKKLDLVQATGIKAKVGPQSVRMETLDPIKVDITNMSKLDLSKYIPDTATEAQQKTSSTYG